MEMRSLSSYWISFIAILALAVFPARADYHYASHEGSDEYPYHKLGDGGG